MPSAFELSTHPIHLGLGATAVVEPEFTGMSWYGGYIERHSGDGDEGRLVSQFEFSESWTSWEVHPRGHEVVVIISGECTLIQEIDGAEHKTTLGPGQYAINEPGVWHTMDVTKPTIGLFITAGAGTEHRER